MKQQWTDEQMRTILDNWKDNDISEVAKMAGMEINALRALASNLRFRLKQMGADPYQYLPKKKKNNFSLIEKFLSEYIKK